MTGVLGSDPDGYVDEAWLEEAAARFRRIGRLRERLAGASHEIEVSVRSPDELVEVRVTAAGSIVDVRLAAGACARPAAELAHSIKAAVTSALDGAQWARHKLERDLFAEYESLSPTARPQGTPGG
ncbi:YbaB/EbfC family nucleoid-associated protein [Pilimelia anulata]|uniref:YbaB/EbfC family nucleoid-associated protein n=1 Tax=Pilimelia anulata TaxID=53371 RepID=UPI001E650AC6|nr:YbaB/EbfC family nucleoid-associated protein [Pilimelia anulata]